MKCSSAYTLDVSQKHSKLSDNFAANDPGRLYLKERVSLHPRNATIADIGCGDGKDIRTFEEMGFSNITGIEPSDSSRQIALERASSAVAIKDGFFENIPLDDNSVDVATARFSLHYCDDLKRAFNEVARVLKPGGKFYAVISDPDLDQEEPRNDDGTISITLFDEQVKITYPLHTLDGYIEAAKKAGLTFDIERRYCGLEADRSKNGKNNSLCFAAALKR
ncbi:MAG: class I SAM-dependent methyltransferase [Rhodospirillales bacterium]|nr:class I SAM-dependent methyltransferase [Alphaproteobacteria bacterium]USO03472.1 MAG: class I SAM-dependent methyltransferase [Rhodospirillales bacterium]